MHHCATILRVIGSFRYLDKSRSVDWATGLCFGAAIAQWQCAYMEIKQSILHLGHNFIS